MNRLTNNVVRVKKVNKDFICGIVKRHAGITKREVSDISGLSIATCSTILNELTEDGRVTAGEFRASQGGRAARVYYYNPEHSMVACVAVLVDRKAMRLFCCVADSYGEKKEEHIISRDVVRLEDILACIAQMQEAFPVISTVAVSIAGILHEGVVADCDDKALRGIALAEEIEKACHVSVVVESEPRVKIYGYAKLHALDRATLAIVTAPASCLGAGFMADGRLLRGRFGMAGEVQYLADENGSNLLWVVRSVISILNPQTVVLSGETLGEGVEERIYEACLRWIPEEFMPKIIYVNDAMDILRCGLIAMALEKADSKVELLER